MPSYIIKHPLLLSAKRMQARTLINVRFIHGILIGEGSASVLDIRICPRVWGAGAAQRFVTSFKLIGTRGAIGGGKGKGSGEGEGGDDEVEVLHFG